MIGSKLGPYELIEEIGHGGMATVFRAYQPNVDRFVAVKVIHRAVSIDKKALERFTREARLIARLEHPHILPVYDYDGLNDPPYIVMRYLPTGTLRDILEREQLPYSEVIQLMAQIGSALDYAHRQGVVHRDIKPSNIMIDTEGNAFLTDFGIARMVEGSEGLTGTGVAVGTPGYMAPEQGLGVPIDGRADIYALGVMLYEMLTGAVPFSAETPMAVILKHINDPVPEATQVNPNLPPHVNQIIQKALAKRPEDRYEKVSDLVQDLRTTLGSISDRTGRRLEAVASETIAQITAKRLREASERPSAPVRPSETPKKGSSRPENPSGSATGTPAQPVRSDSRGIIMGLVAVILLLLAFGGGAFFINITNGNATSTIQQGISGSLTAIAFVQVATDEVTTEATEPSSPSPSITSESSSPSPSATSESSTATNTADDAETATNTRTPTSQAIVLVNTDTAEPTKSPTIEPTKTPISTPTPVPPTETATATNTLLPTSTPTPTETATNTATSTPTNTATATNTSTDTPTVTNTATSTPTDTPTSTPTFTPTNTPTATLTETPTVTPTPTPVPHGVLPYLNDMEDANALDGWDYNSESWSLRTDSGNTSLVGIGHEDVAVVLGKETPEWVTSQDSNVLFSLSVNLADRSSIARIAFRLSEQGYYLLEMRPGSLILNRGREGVVSRSAELPLAVNRQAPINIGPYYDIMIWSDVSRIFVYLNRELVLQAEDTGSVLPNGLIVFQTLNANQRVRFDNLKVQRPLSVSTHLQVSNWPTEWERSNLTGAELRTDSRGNTSIEVATGDVRPIIDNPPADMLLSCRIHSISSGLEIRFRESEAGAYLFKFVGGHMTLNRIDASGAATEIQRFTNFYARGAFFEFTVEAIGNEIRVYDDGELFAQKIADAPPPGGVRFTAVETDKFLIDDCLFAETVKSLTEDAVWAFERIQRTESRSVNYLLDYWNDDFKPNNSLQWWDKDAGEIIANRDDKEHPNFLQLTYAPDSSWRMFKDLQPFYVFGEGLDTKTFFDSSDIYLRVDVQIPKTGTAWIMARTKVSLGGSTLDGFRLDLTRADDGQYWIVARSFTRFSQPIYFEGPLPATTEGIIPEWVTMLVVTYQNKVAFFANGRFIAAVLDVSLLDGTAAIGVDENTIANFDNLELRDVSPETR